MPLDKPPYRHLHALLAMTGHPDQGSLADQTFDPYIFDTGHFEDLLQANFERALVPDDELQIKVIEVGHRGISLAHGDQFILTWVFSADLVFTSVDELDTYLSVRPFQGTRIM